MVINREMINFALEGAQASPARPDSAKLIFYFMIKRFTISVAALLSIAASALACTSLIATPGATADNSVIITYAADSHNLYGELYSSPAKDYPKGAMRKIHDWDTGKYLGEIPQVRHTFATIGNMNEHGLAISESTWGGREELVDTTGIIDYGSLIYLSLIHI